MMATFGKPAATADQIAALNRFAQAWGPRWKGVLAEAWVYGTLDRYAAEDDAALLQQVRNNLGSSWLVLFRAEKMTAPS